MRVSPPDSGKVQTTREDTVRDRTGSLLGTWLGETQGVTEILSVIAVELARQNDLLADLYELQK